MVDLLKASWKVYDALSEVSPTSQLASNLKKLKDVSAVWSMKKKAQDNKDIVDIERELKIFMDNLGFGFSSEMDKLSMIDLESCKRTILCDREKEARQKSRVLWLVCGEMIILHFSINWLRTGNILTLFGKFMMMLVIW